MIVAAGDRPWPRRHGESGVDVVDVVKLARLMQLTSGTPDVVVGLIDGPVALDHPDLSEATVRALGAPATCSLAHSAACAHGTFVAGILSARRGSAAPALCPGCTLLVRPVFAEQGAGDRDALASTPEALATAMADCIAAGARVLNLSLALGRPSSRRFRAFDDVLDEAARMGVLVVAAAGNQRTTGSSCITRHPWVIPTAACSRQGWPLGGTNLGRSIGRHGLCAPGDRITSLGSDGGTVTESGGTSAAAAFVTGAIALLWSAFPNATAWEIKLAVSQAGVTRRHSVTPPLLDGWGAYQALSNNRRATAAAASRAS
jgi:subtilisin family serine protease